MIGLDTNVLVRYVTQDDEKQSARASKLFDRLTEENPGFVSIIVLVESVWVLQRAYHADQAAIAEYLARLLGARELRVQSADLVRRSLRDLVGSGVGFVDSLIALLGADAECEYTVTFDRKAAGALPAMKLLT